MSLITRELGGGLVVAELGMDGAALQHALAQIDDRLMLWPPDGMSPYWRVACRVSDWQEARVVCTWRAPDGSPLPLSSGILAEVDRLRLDGRNKEPDADEFNRQREEQVDREKRARGEAIVEDHRPYVERSRTSVSLADTRRKPEWLKQKRGRL